MIWHIFKKDFRLLWPLSLAVVVLGALSALRTLFEGHFYQPLLERLTFFLPGLLVLGVAIVAVTVVHQDSLSESQEDWLVRPMLRRDLALAKVLFVLLTVNVPLMIVDVLQQLALNFPLSVSIGVAAWRALITVVMFSLPALVLGAVTRSLVDTFVFGTASAIGFVLLLGIALSTLSPSALGLSVAPGMRWISLCLAGVVGIVGSAASLTFQYTARRTLVARGIGLAAVLAALSALVLLPSNIALAIQETLWGPPNSDGIKLSLDLTGQRGGTGQESRIHPTYGLGAPMTPAAAGALAAVAASVDKQIEKLGLPLTISGMRPGDILVADRIDVRLVAMNGKVLYEGAGVCTRAATGGIMCSPNRLEVWASSAGGKDIPSEEQLNVPIGLYQRIKDEPVRVDVAYALSRFFARPTQKINATDGLKDLPEMGSCATRVDGDEDEVELGCLTDVGVPSCAGVVLEDPQTNRHNPELHLCNPQYGPFRRMVFEDAVDRSHLSVPFRDSSGLAHYPVDTAAIAHARIDVTVYDPVGHFQTTLTVPNVRLVDWALPKADSVAPTRN